MNTLPRVVRMVAMATSTLTACNYDEGQCWLRSEDDVGGVGGGPIISSGAGGFGDVPPEPQDASDAPPDCTLAAEVRCASPGSTACVEQCEAIGAYCVHRATHPYSPSSGIGDLYWCKGGSPTWTCSFQYSNGDNCTVIYPISTWICRYPGGK